MIRVGLTGGIGSGKSYVSRVFARLGVPVYHADPRARELMEQSPEIRKELVTLFGPEIYDGEHLDRKRLARAIFGDERLRQRVNAIVHPHVFEDFERWCAAHQEAPYVIQEAAILFESGGDRHLDRVINVSAPLRERLQRVMRRDNITEEEVRARMRSQMSERRRRQRAWTTLVNDGKRLVVPQVVRVHERLLEMNKTKQKS